MRYIICPKHSFHVIQPSFSKLESIGLQCLPQSQVFWAYFLNYRNIQGNAQTSSAHGVALMTKIDFTFPAFSLRFEDFAAQFCFRSKFSFHKRRLSRKVQVNAWKFIYLNCGERYQDMIDHRSYIAHNLSCCEIKACKKFRPEPRDLDHWPLRDWCSSLPTKLSSQLGACYVNVVRS